MTPYIFIKSWSSRFPQGMSLNIKSAIQMMTVEKRREVTTAKFCRVSIRVTL